MANHLTFTVLQQKVSRLIKDYNEAMEGAVKDVINMVYMNEIMVADPLYPLYWLVDFDDSIDTFAPQNITGITNAAAGVLTVEDSSLMKVGDLITDHNISGMTELNDRIAQITVLNDATHVTIGVNTSAFGTYTEGGTIHHRGVTLNISGKNVERIMSASFNDEGVMEPITYKELEASPHDFHYLDTTERPQRYYHGKTYDGTSGETNQLIWHAGADAVYRLRYWFEQRVNALDQDTDTPLLPPRFHNMIVTGAIARLEENNIQVEMPSIWPGLYAQQLRALKDFNKSFWEEAERQRIKDPYLL